MTFPADQLKGAAGGHEQQALVAVDGHVHLHPGFDLAMVLDHAAANFRQAASAQGYARLQYGCLLLTESAGVDRFTELKQRGELLLGGWSFQSSSRLEALVAMKEGELPLVIIAGRQIQTRERLEVLALGCVQHFGEGEPFDTVLAQSLVRSRLSVVPWGFAKWTGKRGVAVRHLVDSTVAGRVFLGDNGGRLRWGPRPELFLAAEQRGVPILPGTDPFPFSSHAARVGQYGFFVTGSVDPRDPGESVLDLLAENRTQPITYGRRTGVVDFVWSQAAIQVRNRFLRK